MSLTLDGTSGITSSGGTNVLQADAVITANLQNGAVTTDKIANLGVTEGKLAANAVTTAKITDANVTEAKIASNAVTTAKINNAAITDAKIDTMAATKLTGDIAAARITNALNATGSAPIYACRAWVNFNNSGIRASGNVSSVTRNSTGNYTINFATAMPDVNYSFSCHGRTPNASGIAAISLQDAAIKSTTQFQFTVVSSAGENITRDTTDGTVTIFR
jgi:hypothetical protein